MIERGGESIKLEDGWVPVVVGGGGRAFGLLEVAYVFVFAES